MKKITIKIIIVDLILAVLIWSAITITVQAFKCPGLTQTELFIQIPRSIILDFKDCE